MVYLGTEPTVTEINQISDPHQVKPGHEYLRVGTPGGVLRYISDGDVRMRRNC